LLFADDERGARGMLTRHINLTAIRLLAIAGAAGITRFAWSAGCASAEAAEAAYFYAT
jgi:hypothetical protein